MVPEKQAKAQVLILHDLISSSLATKRDIAEIQRDIEQLRTDTRNDIETMGYRLTIWLGGIVAGSTVFILGAMFTMAKLGVPIERGHDGGRIYILW